MKTKQLTEVLELASTLSSRGRSWPGLEGERMLCHLLHPSPRPPYNSSQTPDPSSSSMYQTKVSIHINHVGWNREALLGRWGLDALWHEPASTPVVYERFLAQHLAHGGFLINGRCYYHVNRKSHSLPLRCHKFFKVWFRCHFLQEAWL